MKRGYYFTTSGELEIVRELKESLGYCCSDFGVEMGERFEEKSFDLPDGRKITIDKVRDKGVCMTQVS